MLCRQVIGLLRTFKTNSAFGSYSEGRRLWSSVIIASRTFARMAWLHCPDALLVPADPDTPILRAEAAEAVSEKRTYINLVAAFSIALKHYVRGEPGVHYVDLWPLVAFLPRYHRLPSSVSLRRPDLDPSYASSDPLLAMSRQGSFDPAFELHGGLGGGAGPYSPSLRETTSRTALFPPASTIAHPLEASTSSSTSSATAVQYRVEVDLAEIAAKLRGRRGVGLGEVKKLRSTAALAQAVERAPSVHELLPARNPPPRSLDDFIPFYDFFADLAHWLLRRGRRVADKIEDVAERIEGHKGRRRPRKERKKEPLLARETCDNVLLELILLLSLDGQRAPGRAAGPLGRLTGLERVLLTPMPVAYSLHLRHVIWLCLLLLPSQTHESLGWLTVPASAGDLGLLRLGDQIENPLGYDASDLDLESSLTILRELCEVVAHPAGESAPATVLAALRAGAAHAEAEAEAKADEDEREELRSGACWAGQSGDKSAAWRQV
ncbi:hypothetical protein JCM3770_001961 [Rhodotorula araucariae]